MTLKEFTTELESKMASMSDNELLAALMDAGFEFEETQLPPDAAAVINEHFWDLL